ncbi:hypothetical protein WA026_019618 [Henosepilachna vigintioctopunctata]|uniref:Nose resistant-to-fluoxetine protein N-terminal domain-containing protein n=1 Tax=Henosepilachna vigintioctopunctata TaxID=420089 RepID=A0AAW1TVU9_9CUCU
MLRTILCLILYIHCALSELNLRQLIVNAEDKDVSAECYNQFKEMSEMDALFFMRMIDANPGQKISGLLEGNTYNFGQYDECLSIADDSKGIYGKYCLTTVRLSEIGSSYTTSRLDQTLKKRQNLKQKMENLLESALFDKEIMGQMTMLANGSHLGICIPNGCTDLDIQKVLPVLVDESNCYTKFTNQNMNAGAIIALSTICIILVIALSSTVYDIICFLNATKPRHQILVAFSLYTNGMKLLKSSNNSDQLGCLHGIKTISMMWVILGHIYLITIMFAPMDNAAYLSTWLNAVGSMFILSATLTVDTFFTVGGLLTVYVFMKSRTTTMKESFKMVPMLYLHRYIRLTPAYAIVVLAYGSGLIKYMADGPLLGKLNVFIESCANNWWAALLYFQNYSLESDQCIVQSWYICIDFQLFLLTPFILIPLKKWPEYVLPSMAVLGVIGIAIPFYIGYSNNLAGIGIGMSSPEYYNYYNHTHTRFAPYIVGMIFGYYLHKMKKDQKILKFNRVTLSFLWIILVGGLLFCVFDGLKFTTDVSNKWLDGLYLGFNRTIWSVIVSFTILLCCTGNGGVIDMFLSHPVFQVLSKLTYSMFLIHYMIILVVIVSSKNVVHFSNFNSLFQFFAYFPIVVILSAIFSLLFESPMIIIEKIIFHSRNERKV